MPPIIARPGLNSVLVRTLGLKTAEAPASIVAAELNPALVLENDRPEWHLLGGSTLFSMYTYWDQAIANDRLTVWFTVGAGQLHVVEYARVSVDYDAGGGAACLLAWLSATGTNPGSGGSVTCFPVDGRAMNRSLLGTITTDLFNPGNVVDHDHAFMAGAIPNGQGDLLWRGYPIIAREGQTWGVTVSMPAASFDAAEFLINFRTRSIMEEEYKNTNG